MVTFDFEAGVETFIYDDKMPSHSLSDEGRDLIKRGLTGLTVTKSTALALAGLILIGRQQAHHD